MSPLSIVRRIAPLTLVGMAIACATATSGEDLGGDSTKLPPVGDGDGDNNVIAGSGGSTGSGGLTGSSTGGAAATGGASSTGGATSTGGTQAGTGGAPTSTSCDSCDGLGAPSTVSTTGACAVFTCTQSRDSCQGADLNVPSAFECVSSHGPNCASQAPDMSGTTWKLAGSCSSLGMGGAEN